MDLNDQTKAIDQMRREFAVRRSVAARHADTRFEALEKENDQLKLYVATLMRLVVAKGIAGADEIRALVEVVDQEDGEVGRHSGPILPPG